MIRRKQAVDKFPDWALTFGNPDFVKCAESYGAVGRRAERTLALDGAFEEGGWIPSRFRSIMCTIRGRWSRS
jgi:acetolactate synthase-1/2/3 large subunit